MWLQMTYATDRLAQHSAHAEVARVSELIDATSDELRVEADEVEPGGVLSRVAAVVEYSKAALTFANAEITTEAALTALANHANQVANGLTALRDTGNADAQVPPIADAVEALAEAAAALPQGWNGSNGEIRAAAAAIEGNLTARERDLDAKAAELRERLDELQSEATASRDDLDARFAQKTAELEASLAQLEAAITAQEEANATLVQTLQTQFDQAEAARETRTTSTISEQEAKITATLQKASDDATSVAEEIRTKAGELTQTLEGEARGTLDALEEMREEAAKLIDLVSTSATAGAYGKEAVEQKKEADEWRNNAVRAALAAGAVALVALVLSLIWKSDPTLLVAKILLVAALTGVAGYAASQSSRHRKREERARRIQLELTAFDPFIRSLSDDKREAVREAFIDRAFVGHDRDVDGSDSVPALTQNEVSLLGQIMKTVGSK